MKDICRNDWDEAYQHFLARNGASPCAKSEPGDREINSQPAMQTQTADGFPTAPRYAIEAT